MTTQRKQLNYGDIGNTLHDQIDVPLEEVLLDLRKHGYGWIRKKMLAASTTARVAGFTKVWLNSVLSQQETRTVVAKEVFRERLTAYLISEAGKRLWLEQARRLAYDIVEECYRGNQK